MAKCGAFLACIKKYTQQFYLSHVLTSYLHCFSCSDCQVPPRSQGSGADRRCGRDRMLRLCCRRAILLCSNDGAASIPKSGLEIKNRCTQKVVFREILASIRKSGLEIKNRCTQEGLNGEILASILKSEPEIKNRCMQQAIFSTRSLDESLWRHVGGVPEVICVDAGSTVAAKAGADAPGGGISLCFCRRGCAAPALKAATLNTKAW